MTNLTFEQLEQLVRTWSGDRGIFEHSSPAGQTLKAVAEMGELADNVNKGRLERCEDDIGDIIVCLINVAKMAGTDVRTCLETAYNDIKDRKGRMVAGGAFVKEGDN